MVANSNHLHYYSYGISFASLTTDFAVDLWYTQGACGKRVENSAIAIVKSSSKA
jgi:hypothetical protein